MGFKLDKTFMFSVIIEMYKLGRCARIQNNSRIVTVGYIKSSAESVLRQNSLKPLLFKKSLRVTQLKKFFKKFCDK